MRTQDYREFDTLTPDEKAVWIGAFTGWFAFSSRNPQHALDCAWDAVKAFRDFHDGPMTRVIE